ncbi:cytochrome P450 4C1-like isoform X2 [Adelges cooleyi]|nr:cytochrome P450 4C1-like isoform X2 [Adelges cooleyi]
MYSMARLLPGPKTHWFFGNHKAFMSKQNFFNYAMEWRESSPLFNRVFLMFQPIIIIQSPEAVQAIISRKNKHNEKGYIYNSLRPLLGEGLITNKDAKWHMHRKLITPTFHFAILKSFVEVFTNRTRQFIEDLKHLVKDQDPTNDFFDISPHTRALTMDFICETAMGIPLDDDTENDRWKIVNAIHRLEDIATYRTIRPLLWPNWIFKYTQKGKEEIIYKTVLHAFTNDLIKQRRRILKDQLNEECYGELETKGNKKAIFMDLLIETSKNGECLSDDDIRDEVNTFVFAGQNTTQLAINYCLYLLGHNQAVQNKVYEELLNIFGDSDRDPTMEDLKDMRYLENCIKEALRLYPSVPLISRKLTEDEHFGTYVLPKGIDTFILPYILHRDPKQFPNPESFNPDNFLPENSKHRHPYAYIPFSAGPRNCIGKKFAVLAEKTVISAVVRNFVVVSKDPRESMVVVPNTVLVPKNGIRLSLKPRNRKSYI